MTGYPGNRLCMSIEGDAISLGIVVPRIAYWHRRAP
jgi:hypothetical protein